MSAKKRVSRKGKLLMFIVLGPAVVAGISPPAFSQAAAPPQPTQQPPAPKQAAMPQSAKEKAWSILRQGLGEGSADKRAQAVRALGLLAGNAEAEKAALAALKDEKPEVRLAAAAALGSMSAVNAKEQLKEALDDSEPSVALAAANSLLTLKDDSAYEVYYAVLTGEKRYHQGLIREQLKMLRDKKKMAQLGFEEGIGFIPFAGMGYEAFRKMTKDDSSPSCAAAAKKLSHDPNPESAEALVKAATDKSWVVRAAALEAIAQREDKLLLPRITGALDDDKAAVRYAAAACVVHLSELPAKKDPADTLKK